MRLSLSCSIRHPRHPPLFDCHRNVLQGVKLLHGVSQPEDHSSPWKPRILCKRLVIYCCFNNYLHTRSCCTSLSTASQMSIRINCQILRFLFSGMWCHPVWQKCIIAGTKLCFRRPLELTMGIPAAERQFNEYVFCKLETLPKVKAEIGFVYTT
jgi:hypothetical protein